MFSCLVLGKCSANRPSEGRPAGEDKWAGMSKRNSGVFVLKYFEHCIVRYFDVRTIYSAKKLLYFHVNYDIVSYC